MKNIFFSVFVEVSFGEVVLDSVSISERFELLLECFLEICRIRGFVSPSRTNGETIDLRMGTSTSYLLTPLARTETLLT